MDIDFLKPLIKKNNTKIIFLVMDGIGGIPRIEDNKTELEAAYTPNLDMLALESMCGLQNPVGNGITPGSGPGHLGLFGYNPIQYQVGRGVLAANGINFDLKCEDVAARGNFCIIDENEIATAWFFSTNGFPVGDLQLFLRTSFAGTRSPWLQ